MKWLTLAVLVLLIMSTSLAVKRVDISEVDDIFAYPGELIETQIEIENDENEDIFIYTDLRIHENGFSQTFKSSPTLVKEGALQTITLYFKAPEEEETYELEFTIYDNEEELYDREIDLHVIEKSNEFQMSICSNDLAVKRGDDIHFYICVINTGNQDEEFTLKITGWEDLEYQKEFKVKANDDRTVTVQVKTEETDSTGSYELTAQVYGIHTNKKITDAFSINIRGRDQEETSVVSKLGPTALFVGNTTHMNLTITNTGPANIYSLSVDYPENWKGNELEQRYVVVEQGELVREKIDFIPTKEGNYTIGVVLFTEEGLIFSKDVRLTVIDLGNGITGAFVTFVGKAKVPIIAIIILVILIGLYFGLNYLMETEYFYFKFK